MKLHSIAKYRQNFEVGTLVDIPHNSSNHQPFFRKSIYLCQKQIYLQLKNFYNLDLFQRNILDLDPQQTSKNLRSYIIFTGRGRRKLAETD